MVYSTQNNWSGILNYWEMQYFGKRICFLFQVRGSTSLVIEVNSF